jgi:hypothetical protein
LFSGSRSWLSSWSRASSIPAATHLVAHPVELRLLLGIQKPLQLFVCAVADRLSHLHQRIELRLNWFVELAHLLSAALHYRIEACALRRGKPKLLRHAIDRRTTSITARMTASSHQVIGCVSKCPTRKKHNEQENYGKAL